MSTFSCSSTRLVSASTMTLALGSLAVALAASASAHVTVNSTDAQQGGYGKVIVRVPNESETAGTTKVSVSIPSANPIASVRTKPHAGWSVSAPKVALLKPVKQGDRTITEAVSTITWTANPGVSIKAGEFEEFEFSAGQLPTNVTSMSFPAVQTYSDGKVVEWNEAQAKGAAEPEHPAPVLTLLPSKVAAATPVVAETSVTTSNKDSVARGLGAGAVLVAAGGLGLGLQRRRSTGK